MFFRPKHYFCQFRRIGEVDRNRAHTLWFRGVFRSGANLMAEDGVYVAAYDLLESRDRRVQHASTRSRYERNVSLRTRQELVFLKADTVWQVQ